MNINSTLRALAAYILPTTAKTESAHAGESGKRTSSFSFSAMRNNSWAKKCKEFDAAKLARNIRDDPRTKRGINLAQKNLEKLRTDMSVWLKNIRTQMNGYGMGMPGGYQPTSAESQINGQWSNVLSPEARFLPGSFLNPESRVQTVNWHKDGTNWIGTHNLTTGEHTSSTAWSLPNEAGWQLNQTIDHRTANHWYSSRNFQTRQHTSFTAWSIPNPEGWHSRKSIDHRIQPETIWTTFHHAEKNQNYSCTDWGKPDADGISSRTSVDHATNTRWHDTWNAASGDHLAKTDWSEPNAAGISKRTVHNHRTGKSHIERCDASFKTHGKTLEQMATESLKLLALEPNETSKENIKKQYEKLVSERDPDTVENGGDKDAIEKENENAKQLKNAYDFLMSDQFPLQEDEDEEGK